MLSNTTWLGLCKAQRHLKNEIGKVFYSKKHHCYVEIIYYTLSGQLFYTNETNTIRDFIWSEEYFEQKGGENNE